MTSLHQVKPEWWRDFHFYNYHRSKEHNTDNCFKLKDNIQDITDGGIVLVDSLVKNYDHKAFKTPLPDYKKGESSQANKKNHDAKINYTYTDSENMINMLEPVESVFMMRSQGNNDTNHVMPKLVL